jgi:hypothetical protein
LAQGSVKIAQEREMRKSVSIPVARYLKSRIEALTAHHFGHFRCGLRASKFFGRFWTLELSNSARISSRRKENFACVRIFYWRSWRKTEDLDVTGIGRERTGN